MKLRDDYIRRQERKIKKRLWELFRIRHLALFGVCLLCLMSLFCYDPPPQLWESREITVAEMEYRDKSLFFVRTGGPGYMLTDEQGERYWIEADDPLLQVGESYTVRYVEGPFFRVFRSVIQGDEVLIDLEDSAAQWKRELPLWFAVLAVFLLSLLKLIGYVRQVLSDGELKQYREKIRTHRRKQKKKKQTC